jgi:hypothetical protein
MAREASNVDRILRIIGIEPAVAYFFSYAPASTKFHCSHVDINGFCIVRLHLTFALLDKNAIDSVPSEIKRNREADGAAAYDRYRYSGTFRLLVTHSHASSEPLTDGLAFDAKRQQVIRAAIFDLARKFIGQPIIGASL